MKKTTYQLPAHASTSPPVPTTAVGATVAGAPNIYDTQPMLSVQMAGLLLDAALLLGVVGIVLLIVSHWSARRTQTGDAVHL